MKIIICKIEHINSETIFITYRLDETIFHLTCKIDGSDIEDPSLISIYNKAVKRINNLKNSLTLESILFKKF